MSVSDNIPLNIWSYWEGPENKYVTTSYNSWLKHCSNYNIVVINKSNIKQYLPDIDILNLKHLDSEARISDYVRFNILAKHGGIWMDATIILTRPLDWVHNFKSDFVGYWRNASTTNPKYKVVESWFLACTPNNKFMNAWKDEFMKINNYYNIYDYINTVRKDNVDLQNIGNLSYLTCYVACQVIIQKYLTYDEYEKLKLIRMEDTEKYLDSVNVTPALVTDHIDMLPNIIKLTQWNRKAIDRDPYLQKILERFSV